MALSFSFFLMVVGVLWMGSCGREGWEGRGGGLMDGWIDGWVYRWIGGGVDRWIDGWGLMD